MGNLTLFEALTGGAFDRLNWQHSGEFDQNFSKKSNARGFARGGHGRFWNWPVHNELVFAFSFVSSSNTDLETTEQFFLLHTRYLCDFSGLTNFSQKLWSSKKTLISYFVYFFGFLAFRTHDEFFDAFQGKQFRLETVCLFQRLVIGQFIRKSRFLDRLFACWLASEKVVSFFICEER